MNIFKKQSGKNNTKWFLMQRKGCKTDKDKNQNVRKNGYNVHKIYKYSNEEKENKEKGKRKGKIRLFLKNRV